MRFHYHLRAVIVVAITGAALSGCSAQTQSGGTSSVTGPLPQIVTRAGSNAPTVRSNALLSQLAISSCGPCFSYTNSPSAESLYDLGAKRPKRVVTNGIAAPWVGLVYDSSGDLFVANCTSCETGNGGVNDVVEVKSGGRGLTTITQGIRYPYDLVVDRAGTLYASNLGCYSPSCEGSVSEYPSGYSNGPPSVTFAVPYALGMAIDKEGNLYVGNCNSCQTGQPNTDQVLVYAPGSSMPSHVISTGVNEPVALAIDSSDDLYVANCINCGLGQTVNFQPGTDTVTEYAAGGTSPIKTIDFNNPVDVPFTLAVDQAADLYVGNYAVNTVTKYAPNGSTPSITISQGVSAPASLAIDKTGALYVSNAGNGTVTKYLASYHGGSHSPKSTISVTNPSSIAVTPY